MTSVQDIRRALSTLAPATHPDLGRPAAVLVPVFERDGRPHLVLTRRPATMPTHAGQVSFPGGKQEPSDTDLVATALREAEEELAIPPANVEVIGRLDDCPTFVSNFVITPVVGLLHPGTRLVPHPTEIETLLTPALEDFFLPGVAVDETHLWQGAVYSMRAWDLGPHHVWGATARILHQLFVLLGRDSPEPRTADRTREKPR